MSWKIVELADGTNQLQLGQAGSTQTLTTTTGQTNASYWPWNSYIEVIQSAKVVGPVIVYNSTEYMFTLPNATSVDISNLQTTNVTNMHGMFYECGSTSGATTIIGLNSLNTSNTEKLDSMFMYCKATSLDLSSFNTSNVTTMSGMFYNSAATSLDLSSFDTSKVTTMYSMFYNTAATTITGLNRFSTSNVINMSHMFYGANATNLDVSSFKTSNVTNMEGMFGQTAATTITGLNTFDTSNVTKMKSMFINSSATSLDLRGFKTANAEVQGMFTQIKANSITIDADFSFKGNGGYSGVWAYLGSGDAKWINRSKGLIKSGLDFRDYYDANASAWSGTWERLYQIAVYDSSDKSLKFYSGTNAINVEANLTSTQTKYGPLAVDATYGSYTNVPWYAKRTDIQSVTFVDDIYTNSAAYWFYYNTAQTYSGFDKLKGVTNMSCMFQGSKATSLNLSNFDTSKVTTMYGMFVDSVVSTLDLSSFNTSNVTDMAHMFQGSKATSLDLSNFNTSRVGNAAQMFHDSAARSVTIGPNFKFNSQMLFPDEGFYGAESLWTNSSKSLAKTNIELRDNYNANANEWSGTWVMEGAIAVFKPETGALEFYSLDKETQLRNEAGINGWSVYRVPLNGPDDMRLQPSGDYKTCVPYYAHSPYIKSVSFKDRISPIRMDYWFAGLGSNKILLEINSSSGPISANEVSFDLAKLDTSNVYSMFNTFSYLLTDDLDLSGFDTSEVWSMREMFANSQATSISFPQNFGSDTRIMYGMFQSFTTTTLDLRSLDTSNVIYMSNMFQYSKATTLDLSSFDTSNVTNMSNMFDGSAATSITLGPNFKFSNNFITDNNYKALFTTPSGNQYTGKWIKMDGLAGPYTPVELRDNYDGSNPDHRGAWVWQLKPPYTIVFNPGEHGTGSMANEQASPDEDYAIPRNSFVSEPAYRFAGWKDNKGNVYELSNLVIPANRFESDETVTLTAQWEDRNNVIKRGEGEYDIYLRNNENVTFKDIPAGTAYQIWEETPSGWVLVKTDIYEVDTNHNYDYEGLTPKSGTSGIIQPTKRHDAQFTNEYDPSKTRVQFNGTKTLDNQFAKEDSFEFELYEVTGTNTETFIEKVAVSEGGLFTFSAIEYLPRDIGQHRYRVKEAVGNDNRINYDTHVEEITVTVVQKDDDTLEAIVEYDNDGIVFANTTKPGKLLIKKTAEGLTEDNKNDIFAFKVTLANENGMPLSSGDTIKWRIQGSNRASLFNRIASFFTGEDPEVQKATIESVNSAKIAQGDYEGIQWSLTAGGILTLDTNINNELLIEDIFTYEGYPWFNYASKIKAVQYTEVEKENRTGAIETEDNKQAPSLLMKVNADEGNILDSGSFAGIDWRIIELADGTNQLQIGNPDGVTQQTISGANDRRDMWPWRMMYDQIDSIKVVGPVNTVNNANIRGLFGMRHDANPAPPVSKVKTIDVTLLDVTNVANIGDMFRNHPALTEIIGYENWNTSKVTDASAAFQDTPNLTEINISNWDMRVVRQSWQMFMGAGQESGITITFGQNCTFETVTNMNRMFQNCGASELDLQYFSMQSVTNSQLANFFYNMNNLKRVRLSEGMWRNSNNNPRNHLSGHLPVSKYDTWKMESDPTVVLTSDYIMRNYTINYHAWGNQWWKWVGVIAIYDSSDGSLKFYDSESSNVPDTLTSTQTLYNARMSGEYGFSVNSLPGWHEHASDIKSVSFVDHIKPINMDFMFADFSNPELTFDFTNLDTSELNYMRGTFYGLTQNSFTFDLPTPRLNSLANTFQNARITNLDFGNHFNTSNVTNMESTFHGAKILNLDLSKWNTSNVTNMHLMFNGFEGPKLDISAFNTSKVTTVEGMLADLQVERLVLGNFKTKQGINNTSFMDSSNILVIEIGPEADLTYLFEESHFGGTYAGQESKWVSQKHPEIGNVKGYNSTGSQSGTMLGYLKEDIATYHGLWYKSYFVKPKAIYDSRDKSLKFYSGLAALELDLDPNYQTEYEINDTQHGGYPTPNEIPWFSIRENVRYVEIVDEIHIFETDHWFYGFKDVEFKNMSNIKYTLYNPGSATGHSSHNVESMFEGVVADTVDLSGLVTYENAPEVYINMFKNAKIRVLDISDFNLHNAIVNDFFANAEIKEIILGENTTFKDAYVASAGPNFSDNPFQLPTPSTEGTYTGLWVKEDGTKGPLTPEEIAAGYDGSDPAWRGKWIWDGEPSYFTLSFNGNGGVSTQSPVRITALDNTYITIPDGSQVYRIKHNFLGWNTEPDGSGEEYVVGQTYNFADKIGQKMVLYAQWERSEYSDYRVEHYQQNTSLSDYTLVETETIYGEDSHLGGGDSVTPAVKNYPGFISPTPITEIVKDDGSLLVRYYYDRMIYTIAYDGNNASSGSMASQTYIAGTNITISDNKENNNDVFKKYRNVFNGWNTEPDGSGTPFAAGFYGDIHPSLFNSNNRLTLYAQWTDISGGQVSPTEGVVYVYAMAGETIEILDLPAGTTYTIEEIDLPNGWILDSKSGEVGTIASNTTSESSFKNKYSATGEGIIELHKRFVGDTLKEDQFSFKIFENDVELDIQNNGALDTNEEIAGLNGNNEANPWYMTGPVEFRIHYTMEDIGVHTYKVVEYVENPDEQIEYDTHEETVVVTVKDSGDGTLLTDVVYQGDALFVNEMKKGSLKLTKTILNATETAKQVEHEFTINIKDAQGNVLRDAYPATIYHNTMSENEDVERYEEEIKAIAHTTNISGGYSFDNYTYADYQMVLDENDSTLFEVDKTTTPYRINISSTSLGMSRADLLRDMHISGYYDDTTDIFGKETTLGVVNVTTAANITTKEFIENATLKVEYDLDGGDRLFIYLPDGTSVVLGVTNTSGVFETTIDEGNVVHFDLDYGIDPRTHDKKGFYAELTATQIAETITRTSTATTTEETITLDSDRKVKLKGGDYVVVEGLPNGATYEIEETPTVGWELTGTVQPNGTIVAASLKEAEFTNTYGSIGQVEIPVRKLFNGGDLSEEQFRFDLYDNQYNVVDVVYTDDKGNASFLIFYDQNDDGKTFEYQIKEFIPDENHSQIIYDKHIERFKVTVKDNGTGELVATVDYDDDGVLFENTFDGYDLVVQKDISGEIKSDEEYEFEITLYDSEGVDLTDADAVNAYIEQIKTNPSGLLKYTGKVGVGDVEYLISIKTGETINTTNRDLTHEVNSTVNHVDIVDGVGRFTLKGGESIILQEFKDQVFYQIREVNGDTTTTDAFNEIGLINQTIDYTSLGPIDVRFAESLNDSMNAPSYKEIEASRLVNVLYLDMVTAVGPQAESIKMIAQLSDVMEPFNVSDLANYTRVYVAGSDAISASAYTTSYDRDKNQIIVEIPITDNIMNYMNKAGRENGLVDIEKSNSNHRGLAHNVEVVTAVKFVNHPNLDAYTEYDEDNNVIVKVPVSSSYELTMHEMANNENKVIQTRESFDSYVVVKDAENVHYTAKLEKWISDIGIDSDVLDLESFVDNKSFTYHLKTYVPDKATSFRIVDDLSGMPGISLDSTNYEATVDGNENILDISITNNSVIATLSEEQLKRYAGTVVEIKVGASLTGTFDATTNDYAQMKGVDGRYRLVNQAQYETTINGQLVTRKSNQAMIVWNRDDDSDVVRFHNFRKEKDHVNLRILKTNEDGSRGLENAEFTLDKIVSAVNNPSGFGMNNGVPMIDENFAQKRFTTLSNGARVLQVSEPGWYMLSEIAAPVGYQMNEGKYYIYLENDDEASIHVYYDDYTDTQPRTYEEIRANFKELTRTNDNTMPAFIYDASVDPNYSSENDDALKGKVWYAIKNKATTQLIVQKDVHGFSENLEFNFRMGLYDDGGNLITDAATLSAYNELISVDIRDENGELLFNANYPVTYKRSGDYRYIFDGMNYYKSSIRGGAWSKVSDVDELNTVAANYNSYPDMAKEEFFGSDGYHTFIIEANQTYNVKNLPDNMKYKVEELIGRRTYGTSGSAVNEEKQKWYVVSRNAEGTIGNRAGEGATLPEDIYPTDLSISFVHYVNLQETIYKVDKYKQDPKKAITGAEFKLTNISKQQDIYERGSVVSTFAVDRKGKYSFNELDFTQEEAWYLLEETKIPDGYLDPYAPWFIKVGNQKTSTLKQAYLSFIKDTHYVYDEENDSMHVLTAAQRQVIDTSNDIPTTIAGHDGCYVHDNPQFTYCTYPTPHYYYNSGNGDQELSADDIATVEANVQVEVDATNNLYKVKKFAYYKDGEHYFYSDGRQINDAKDLALIGDGDESIEDTSYLLHPYITVFEVVSVEDYTGQTIGEDQIVIDAKVYTITELLNYEVFDEETPGFLIENTSQYNLPSSGGIGTYIFTLFGSIVLGLSFLVLYGKKRRKRSVVNG
ncbi:MAG: BspA family leucine-rich repeat surface protein [Solobacterium sp.]|nr:BspA family leucine-rich repeat surface protein [Solobacterium sp.]